MNYDDEMERLREENKYLQEKLNRYNKIEKCLIILSSNLDEEDKKLRKIQFNLFCILIVSLSSIISGILTRIFGGI